MTHRVYIGLGANLGDPIAQVERALCELRCLGSLRASSLYRTEPLGDADQPWYVNAVAELDVSLEPEWLLRELKALEQKLGREPTPERWAPRALDLDLLFYDDVILDLPGLCLPHAGVESRRFVLEPLVELRPGLRYPPTGQTVEELLKKLDDPLRVEKLPHIDRPPEAGLLEVQ